KEGQTSARAAAVVDVALHAEIRLHGVDESAVARVIAGEAHRRVGTDRYVRGHLQASAGTAVLNRLARQLADRFGDADLRLIGDVADRSRLRSGAEERALRPTKYFDTVQIEEVDVRGEQRKRNHRLVE